MKFFIGRLSISEAGSGACHLDQALLVAKDEAQAKDLNESRAMMWAGDDGQIEVGGAWRFHDEKSGTFFVHANGVLEISATAFDDLKDWLQVFGDRQKAEAESQEPAEAVKTLARRIGDQLVKHDVKVSHSKLLHAIAASVGATDWQVLRHAEAPSERVEATPPGVRVDTKGLGTGRFQVDGFVDGIRVIEIDNRLDPESWYLGQAGTLPWKHIDAKKTLACLNAVFQQVSRLQGQTAIASSDVEAPAYADRPPAGYRLADKRQAIQEGDLVYWPGTSTRNAQWAHPVPGQNILGATVSDCWSQIQALAVPVKPVEVSKYPRGNWPTTKLTNIEKLDFAARVNALWLTHGDVELAAKLLHVHPEALLNSFVDAMDADTAFCGRMANWRPEHSLATNLGVAELRGQTTFRTDRRLSLNHTSFTIDGYLGATRQFQVGNAKDKYSPAFTWFDEPMPTGLREVGMLAACLNEALREAYNELRSDWQPPKD
jgi:hypothetical protein